MIDTFTVPCKRKTCDNELNVNKTYKTSYEKDGFCSSRCARLVHSGEERSRAMNGGIAKDDSRTTYLRNAGFELSKKYGYTVDRWWVYPHNGARIDFTYTHTSDSTGYKTMLLLNVQGYYLDAQGKVRNAILAAFEYNDSNKITILEHAVEYAQSLKTRVQLQDEIDNLFAPREEELEALHELARSLEHHIVTAERQQKDRQASFKSTPNHGYHAEIVATSGALHALELELDQVNLRIANKLHPTQSPVAPHGRVPVAQLQLPGGSNYDGSKRNRLLNGESKEGSISDE